MDKYRLDGLSDGEASLSRAKYGSNEIVAKKKKSFLIRLFENFLDPMIFVLLIALAINAVMLLKSRDWFESVGIALAVLIAVVVSAVSEHGSEAAFEKLLSASLNLECRVRRNGKLVAIKTSEVVVGDIVALSAGDRIPADGTIVYGALDVDQSSLNGESKEALKRPSQNSGLGSPQSDAKNDASEFLLDSTRLFCGTVAVSGDGLMRVESVGASTFYGRLAHELTGDTRSSPLKIKLNGLAKKISIIGYTGAFFAALAYLFNAIVIKNMFNTAVIATVLCDFEALAPHLLKAATLAVTVIVMAVPEGLPMMVTVVLSANMKRMLKNGVLVRKLVGIETAGSLNILFTDKTGTLTAGKLETSVLVFGNGQSVSALETNKKCSKSYLSLLNFALLNNTACELSGAKALGGNATDRALTEFGARLNGDRARRAEVVDRLPFNSDIKLMATLVRRHNKNIALVKGAPEKLLPACTHYIDQNGDEVALNNKSALFSTLNELNKRAIRVVAVAMGEDFVSSDGQAKNLRLIALVGIRDNIRPEAALGVRQISRAGIQLVMITGDAKATARAVALECGILNSERDLVLTSKELSLMGDEELKRALPSLRVVARALPSDKSRLVRLAQSLNLVAGMTGDGINDAPALKLADVGFAMGSGTEVTKEASDIIILDDNLLSISRAVSYGRTIFKSIRKFIIFQLTVNFCALAVSIVAPFIGVESPITVIQMLWINLVIDTLAGLAFGGEQPRISYMNEPPKRRDEPIINRYMWQAVLVGSVYSAVVSIVFLKSPWFERAAAVNGSKYALTAFFSLFMFLAIFNSFNARTHRLNLLDYLALNKQFMIIMFALSLVQIVMIFVGGSLFRTQPLSFGHIVMVLTLAFSIVPVDIIRKTLYGGELST